MTTLTSLMSTTNNFPLPPQRRCKAVAFLISTAEKLKTPPIIKYSALSLFSDRFLPTITTTALNHQHYLFQNPQNYSTLQLFSLISLWISSKIHGTPQLPLKTIKLIGDVQIKDQHYTKTDYLQAEVLFLQCVSFEIGTVRNSVFLIVEELFTRFNEVAKVAEIVEFHVCLDVLDLVYECERISRLFVERPVCVAAGVLVVAYVVTVSKRRCEFPVVSWVRFVSGCSEEDVVWVVRLILELIVGKDI